MNDFDLPDVNVLVALLHPDHLHHRPAQEWFASVDRFATTPITESGFLRVALNPLVGGDNVDVGAALASLRSLREHARAGFVADDSSLAKATIDLSGLVGFKQVTDFHLVNLAARHAARLVTFDTKISRTLTSGDVGLVHTIG